MRLSVRDLRASFGAGRGARGRAAALRVLDGVSFEVRAGEIVGLLGPNGCGKSTTLRVLCGLLVPDAGELWLDGQRIAPGARALRSRMGVVFQAPSLDARLSVRENLSLSAALQRADRAAERIASALELAQLEARAEDRVLDLSGGMKRRLELARALLHEPELLLLDEPTTGLDEVSYQRVWEKLAEQRERLHASILLTTHRAEEAARCDRVIVLDQGKIVAEGTPAELVQHVSGDVLTLEPREPSQLPALAAQLETKLALAPRSLSGKLVLEHERGHELIPRLIEALPAGSVASVSMHRPTLADVFVKLTGRSLLSVAAEGEGLGAASAKASSGARAERS